MWVFVICLRKIELFAIILFVQSGSDSSAECPGPIPVDVGADHLKNRRHGQSVSTRESSTLARFVIFRNSPQHRRPGEVNLGSDDTGGR